MRKLAMEWGVAMPLTCKYLNRNSWLSGSDHTMAWLDVGLEIGGGAVWKLCMIVWEALSPSYKYIDVQTGERVMQWKEAVPALGVHNILNVLPTEGASIVFKTGENAKLYYYFKSNGLDSEAEVKFNETHIAETYAELLTKIRKGNFRRSKKKEAA